MRPPPKKKKDDPVLAADWNLLIDAITARTPCPSAGLELTFTSSGFTYRSRPTAASAPSTSCGSFQVFTKTNDGQDEPNLFVSEGTAGEDTIDETDLDTLESNYGMKDDDGNCTSTCSGSWTHRNGQRSTPSHTWVEAGTTSTWGCSASDSTSTFSYDGSSSCTPTEDLDDNPHSSGSGSSVSDGESGVSTCTDGVMTTTVTSGGTTFTITHATPDCGCTDATPDEPTPDTKTYTECEEVPECDLTFPDWPEWESDTPDDPPPELEDGQGHESTAIRDWSPGGATKTETKIQWRLIHSPTGTCYLKDWLRKTTTVTGDPDADPPVADTVTTDDDETYEWEGTGNPCIADPDKGASDPSNNIVGEENDIDPPEENGSITIEILKFSCVRGYEPDVSDEENPQPNGYPDPAWEAEAP